MIYKSINIGSKEVLTTVKTCTVQLYRNIHVSQECDLKFYLYSSITSFVIYIHECQFRAVFLGETLPLIFVKNFLCTVPVNVNDFTNGTA